MSEAEKKMNESTLKAYYQQGESNQIKSVPGMHSDYSNTVLQFTARKLITSKSQQQSPDINPIKEKITHSQQPSIFNQYQLPQQQYQRENLKIGSARSQIKNQINSSQMLPSRAGSIRSQQSPLLSRAGVKVSQSLIQNNSIRGIQL